jgi:hypothetical protein
MHKQICIKAENNEKRKSDWSWRRHYYFSSSSSILHLSVVDLNGLVWCILACSVIVLVTYLTCIGWDEAPWKSLGAMYDGGGEGMAAPLPQACISIVHNMVEALGSLHVVLDVQPLLHLGLRRMILLQQLFLFILVSWHKKSSSNQILSPCNK